MIIDSGPSGRDFGESNSKNSFLAAMLKNGQGKIESHEMRSIEVLSEKGIKQTLAEVSTERKRGEYRGRSKG